MNWMRVIANRFALMDFRLRRAEFYRDFAEMYQRNEAMVTFLEGEIANAQVTRQRSRARARCASCCIDTRTASTPAGCRICSKVWCRAPMRCC
jgi:hypothetical protein